MCRCDRGFGLDEVGGVSSRGGDPDWRGERNSCNGLGKARGIVRIESLCRRSKVAVMRSWDWRELKLEESKAGFFELKTHAGAV